jgi:hypothetical protein
VKRNFRVIERVVFHYVHVVKADSKAEAKRIIDGRGDGEALTHDEVGRNFSSVEEVSMADLTDDEKHRLRQFQWEQKMAAKRAKERKARERAGVQGG